jgi:hypothetical protein
MRERDVRFAEATNAWWFSDRATGEWSAHKREAMHNIAPHFAEDQWRDALRRGL